MRILVVLLILSTACAANTLSLEYAQEGEPEIPRALIVIHNVFESREDTAVLLQRWGERDWARSQYCSLYVYEYTRNGLYDLETPEALGKDLYSRISRGTFRRGQPDEVNPALRTEPTDPRQPDPTTRGDTELILVGSGYGGVVAREVARLARADERKVVRVAYLGSPLDGLTTTELLLGMTLPERARGLGLPRTLTKSEFDRLSPAWWSLVQLSDRFKGWGSHFAEVHSEALGVVGFGTARLPFHPTDNVLYGRGRKLTGDDQQSDGFVPQASAWARHNGPIPWAREETLIGVEHSELTEKSNAFLIDWAVETQTTHSYLVRRQVIEETIKGDGELPPIGVYWDERVENWQNAYASAKGLYEMMWLVSP